MEDRQVEPHLVDGEPVEDLPAERSAQADVDAGDPEGPRVDVHPERVELDRRVAVASGQAGADGLERLGAADQREDLSERGAHLTVLDEAHAPVSAGQDPRLHVEPRARGLCLRERDVARQIGEAVGLLRVVDERVDLDFEGREAAELDAGRRGRHLDLREPRRSLVSLEGGFQAHLAQGMRGRLARHDELLAPLRPELRLRQDEGGAVLQIFQDPLDERPVAGMGGELDGAPAPGLLQRLPEGGQIAGLGEQNHEFSGPGGGRLSGVGGPGAPLGHEAVRPGGLRIHHVGAQLLRFERSTPDADGGDGAVESLADDQTSRASERGGSGAALHARLALHEEEPLGAVAPGRHVDPSVVGQRPLVDEGAPARAGGEEAAHRVLPPAHGQRVTGDLRVAGEPAQPHPRLDRPGPGDEPLAEGQRLLRGAFEAPSDRTSRHVESPCLRWRTTPSAGALSINP